MMTPRTLAAAALCLAVGAGGGFAGGRLSADSSTTDDSTTRRTTENIAVERRSLAVNETTTGELAASSTTELTLGPGTITTASTIGDRRPGWRARSGQPTGVVMTRRARLAGLHRRHDRRDRRGTARSQPRRPQVRPSDIGTDNDTESAIEDRRTRWRSPIPTAPSTRVRSSS
jgi:hypothetical protein